VLRELLDLPFIGAEELTRFMLICVVFVTLPYVVASGTNIRLEEGLHLMGPSARRLFEVLIAATGALILAVAAVSVAVATLRNLQNATPTLGIPYYVFFSAAFFGLLFAAIETALQLWKTLTRRPPYVTFADEASPDDMDALEAALVAEADRGVGETGR
jgi:TRAP-type C4-dicarboxylate transport system permease small subunit